jgi:RNA polymerase sigma factor (sigma-70 family)
MYLAVEVLRGWATGRRSTAADAALPELEAVYAFLYARVGNRADAEDLTQEVALKALPRLRDGAPVESIRSYLYATARSVLATFWSRRFRLPESELPDDLRSADRGHEVLPPPAAADRVVHILAGLTPDQRRVLELRFLQGCSLKEAAAQMGKTVGSVKLMQLRALRKAATR